MSDALSLPLIIAGRYVPKRLIAKGGMGAVYEVEHSRTGQRFALKVLLSGLGASRDALERFKREARAPALIDSEHIVRIIDADVAPELGGAPFLVMELLVGTDLESLPREPSAATVVDWLRQVAVAIDGAHRLGIIHRDLKPENLFLTQRSDGSPLVKVLDFGIAKMAHEGTFATASGAILGTPKYMAPEQASTSAEVTPATDCYALGLVAYRLLTGESYFRSDGGNIMSVLAQVLQPLQPPSQRHPELTTAFDAWFAKACHRLPEYRFRSASQQIESLAAVLGLPNEASETPLALQTTISAQKGEQAEARSADEPAPMNRPALSLVLIASALLLAVAAVGWYFVARAPTTTASVPPSLRGLQPKPSISAESAAGPVASASVSAPPAEAAPVVAPIVDSAAPVAPARSAPLRRPALRAANMPAPDPFADQK